jgi:hypothetical protein
VTVVVHRPEAHFPRRERQRVSERETERERDRERQRQRERQRVSKEGKETSELNDKLISPSRLCSGHNAEGKMMKAGGLFLCPLIFSDNRSQPKIFSSVG